MRNMTALGLAALIGAAALSIAPRAALAMGCHEAIVTVSEAGYLSRMAGDGPDIAYVDAVFWRTMNGPQRMRLLDCLEEVIAGPGNTFMRFELRSVATGKPVARIRLGKQEIIE